MKTIPLILSFLHSAVLFKILISSIRLFIAIQSPAFLIATRYAGLFLFFLNLNSLSLMLIHISHFRSSITGGGAGTRGVM
ncbi:hypothetical protein EDD21DRAFT_137606 [Dissophora ornata]|nr:hypothetical protein EDD21DRAFT_137606 [Dissophora ornata]